MNDHSIRPLLVPWLSLPDAMALRCVSRAWRHQTLAATTGNDRLWDALVDGTHGSPAGDMMRQSLQQKGYELAKRIEHNNRPTPRDMEPNDVTGLLELWWKPSTSGSTSEEPPPRKTRKTHLGSFVIDKVCTFGKPTWPEDAYIRIPNPYCDLDTPNEDKQDKLAADIRSQLEARASFFRRDTGQSFSFVFELDGGTPDFQGGWMEVGLDAYITRHAEHTLLMGAYMVLIKKDCDWKEDLDQKRVKFRIEEFFFSFHVGTAGSEDEHPRIMQEDGTIRNMGELLAALQSLSWTL